jgi:undecaprenyl-diphosphatase
MFEWLEMVREAFRELHAGYFPDLGVWSYLFLTLLVATEGPLSTLLGAAAAAAGILDVRWVFLSTMVGNVAGDSLWYALGYMGKTGWLLRCGGWLGIEPRHLARLEREMHAHAAKLIVFAKLAYGLIVPTLVAAGMSRVPWRRWFPVVFSVETLWSLALVWVGFHATEWIAEFEHWLQIVGAVALIVLIGGIFWLIRRRIERTEVAMDPLLHAPTVEIAGSTEDAGWVTLLAEETWEGEVEVGKRVWPSAPVQTPVESLRQGDNAHRESHKITQT